MGFIYIRSTLKTLQKSIVIKAKKVRHEQYVTMYLLIIYESIICATPTTTTTTIHNLTSLFIFHF